ncbi:MAG: hypothetical protein KAI99_12385 [Cyclobacteriaceae bacterium]|nr:hypothetical protein [Cyclobacteriaceae bacterium]MCK5704128.1 hypothetical protein [Cyclobacteriaceae bacterium]
MSENIVLVQALAELAYSIALADGELEDKEKDAFNEIIEAEMGKSAWSAKNRFAILEERISPNIEQSYKAAMFAIKTNKKEFDDDLKRKYINVIERIADSVEGLRNKERKLISRFKKDIELI